MKVIILAGGFGTRLSEYTELVPKPMVEIGGIPIIWHIMQRYSSFGHKDFYIALGYKSDVVKKYFLNYCNSNSDLSIDFKNRKISYLNDNDQDWKTTLIDTGNKTLTGGRLKRLEKYIDDDTFMFTYGDGLSNVNLDKLLDFHYSHGKIATITAVHPTARFGELILENEKVLSFKEKPQMNNGWINGGFFIFNKSIFSFLENDECVLEGSPLEELAQKEELMAFKHEGFWQCMDTKRDLDYLNKLWYSNRILWDE
tara:strand:- start:11 stop:775 length:765 start_codon:yes stop_codon:yes gene_type:complete